MHPHGHGLREEDAAFHADMKLKSRSLYHTKSFSFLHGPTQALHPYYRLIARTYIPRSQSPPNRHIPPPLTPPPDHNRIIIIDAPRPIIRHAAQTPKNIPNIIRRRHPLRKRLIPPVQNPLHHLHPRQINILNRRLKAPLVRIEEIVRRRLALVLPVEIRRRAHDDDAAEIREVVDGAAEQRFERGVVFLRRGAIQAAAVGEERGRVLERARQDGAAVVDVRGGDVAGDDAGSGGPRGVSRCQGVVGAVGDGGGRVVEGRRLREADGDVSQGFVDFEDFGAVDALGVFRGDDAALRDVACGEVCGDFARVEFVLQGHW